MIIRIGYSGSRQGMTRAQMIAVYWNVVNVFLVHDSAPGDFTVEAHHGDCIGGDGQFHVIATVLGCRTVAHPPANPVLRAWCQADEIRPPKDYLARDRDIAWETGELLAAPDLPEPSPGSGTWATIGYALRFGRPARVFLPDGTMRLGADIEAALSGMPR